MGASGILKSLGFGADTPAYLGQSSSSSSSSSSSAASSSSTAQERPVRAIAITNFSLSAGTASPVIDGVTLVVGDRVALVGQASTVENGVYAVTSVSPLMLARAPEANGIAELAGFIAVAQAGSQ